MEIMILGALAVLIALVLLLIFLVFTHQSTISDHALSTTTEIKNIGESIGERINSVKGQNDSLLASFQDSKNLGQSLKDLLQAPKLRGDYAEAVLEELLERVLPQGIWERQYTIAGAEKVDCVVKIRDVVVPIDAKFPRDDYMRYLEASEDASRKAEIPGCWRNFERAVRTQIGSIESKYIKPERGTTDFALMFIPSEAIYYEAIAGRNHFGEPSTIFDYAQQHRVIPVSPNTFYAFLQIVILGIRNIEVIKSARKLQEGLAALQRSFDLFYKKYEEMGKGIERAAEAHRVGSHHVDRYKRNLDDTLQLEGLQEAQQSLPEDLSAKITPD